LKEMRERRIPRRVSVGGQIRREIGTGAGIEGGSRDGTAYLEGEGGESGDGLLDGDGHVAGAAKAKAVELGGREQSRWDGSGSEVVVVEQKSGETTKDEIVVRGRGDADAPTRVRPRELWRGSGDGGPERRVKKT
jgi:hypothetical protein